MRVRSVAILGVLMFGCGGGNVDRGFYGEIEEQPRGATGPSTPGAAPKRRPPERRPFDRPKLVVIRAGWCDICKAVEPSLQSTYESYKGEVDLVVLDVSDETTVAKSHQTADDEGVREFFVKYGARTPTVGVFTGKDQGRLVHGNVADPEVLKRELDHALGR